MTALPQNNGQNQVNCKITRIKLLDGTLPTKAFVDIRIGPAILHGFCVIANKNGGLFVAPPAKLTKDKKNYPYVTLDEDFRERFSKSVVKAYQLEKSRVDTKEPEPEDDQIPF